MEADSKKLCKNCGSPLHGPFCHQCGQKVIIQRWSVRVLLKSFWTELSNLEKGFWYTIKMLFVAPGQLVRDYWNGKTVQSYNPFKFVLILTAINLALSFWLGIDDLLQERLQPASIEDNFSSVHIERADQQFDAWLNALVILLIPAVSLATYWLFKKHQQNYAEHIIMNAFMVGQQSAISSVTQFFFYSLPFLSPFYIIFNFLIGMIYNSYVYRQVFRESYLRCILKALLIGMFGLVIFGALIALASAVAIWNN